MPYKPLFQGRALCLLLGDIVIVMKQQFNIPDTTECRISRCHMTKNFVSLTNLEDTLADASIQGGQVSLNK